jgi:hypothetical protein
VNVYCFDVDGTLESSSGPVSLSDLDALMDMDHVVLIVSPSSAVPERYAKCLTEGTRADNLKEARKMFDGGTEYIYVSDNPGDEEVAREAGFTFLHPNDWNA